MIKKPDKNVEEFINIVKSLFAGIPYSNVPLTRYEDYYKSGTNLYNDFKTYANSELFAYAISKTLFIL